MIESNRNVTVSLSITELSLVLSAFIVASTASPSSLLTRNSWLFRNCRQYLWFISSSISVDCSVQENDQPTFWLLNNFFSLTQNVFIQEKKHKGLCTTMTIFLFSDYCTQVSTCIEEQDKNRNEARKMGSKSSFEFPSIYLFAQKHILYTHSVWNDLYNKYSDRLHMPRF